MATPNGGIALNAYTPIATGPAPLLELLLAVDELLLPPELLLAVDELLLAVDVALEVDALLDVDVPLDADVLLDAALLLLDAALLLLDAALLLLDAEVLLDADVLPELAVPAPAPPGPAVVLPEPAAPPAPPLMRLPVPTAHDARATTPRRPARARMRVSDSTREGAVVVNVARRRIRWLEACDPLRIAYGSRIPTDPTRSPTRAARAGRRA
jgi:hypothetical protein